MSYIDVDQKCPREPASCNPHNFIILLECRFNFLFNSICVLAQNSIIVESLIFNGSRLIIQRMIRKIGSKESFGAVTQIDSQNIKCSNLRICSRAYSGDFAMLPIQCRENQIIINVIGFLGKINFATCLAALLGNKTFSTKAFINQYRNELASR